MSSLRSFSSSLQGPSKSSGADTQSADAGADQDQTDDSKLVAPGTVFVSPDGGTTDEPFPQPDTEYDFCANIVNAGKLPSGGFFVLFKLSGDMSFEASAAFDDG